MILHAPLRVRLALAFAIAYAVALAAIGSALYFQTKANLDDAIDGALRTRARTLAALADRPARMQRADEFFQLLGPRNDVVAASRTEAAASLLTGREFARAAAGPTFLWRGESARLLAEPGPRGGVIVVGSPLDQREHALEGLATALLVGGLLALAIASAAGFWLATRALRPVEQMRRRAETISELQTDERLPLPVAHDELHRLGTTLNAMLARLARVTRRERRFVADASHELRTPLARLRSELELARGEQDPVALREVVDSALVETEHLSTLAADLLTLASVDDEPAMTRATVDLSALALSCCRDLSARAGDGRAVETTVSPGAEVRGDREALRRAIDNLLENALRHGDGTTRLVVRRDPAGVALTVEDEGTGFDADYLPRAFERFSRAPSSRATAGTGLGLAIVDAIVRRHGGHARAENGARGGARVTLTFPSRGVVSGDRERRARPTRRADR